MKMNCFGIALFTGLLIAVQVGAAPMPMMNHGRMLMDMSGKMVMGQNTDRLPPGCRRVSEEVQIKVQAGHKYARPFPGTIFGYSEHEWRVKPCARVTVTLINEDQVRHQWMLHDLPEEVYPDGMFHLEVTGPGEVSGTFIAPAGDRTYLVHCDIPQHTEKGMKAQLVVGKGSRVLPGIPGISPPAVRYESDREAEVVPEGRAETQRQRNSILSGMLVLGVVLAIIGAPYALRWMGRRFFGMSGGELSAYLFERLMMVVCGGMNGLRALWRMLRSTPTP